MFEKFKKWLTNDLIYVRSRYDFDRRIDRKIIIHPIVVSLLLVCGLVGVAVLVFH
jgi:hypothetical protein